MTDILTKRTLPGGRGQLVALAAALVVACSCAQQPSTVAAAGDDPHIWPGFVPAAKQHVQARLPQLEALPPLEEGVLFIGDSITEGAPLHAMFPRLPVANYGIGWDTTDGLLLRLGQIARNRAERAFIMIGTNDTSYGHSARHITENIELAVTTLSGRLPTTEFYVISILPREAAMSALVQETNAMLQQRAKTGAFTYLDLARFMATEEGTLKPELTFDSLHLNVHGYALWASVLNECVWQGCDGIELPSSSAARRGWIGNDGAAMHD